MSSARTMSSARMNPAQEQTLAAIRIAPADRIAFPADLADQLHSQLSEELEDTAKLLKDNGADLWMSKRALAAVNGCEATFMAERETPFEYNIATARGAVLHRGVEYWANPVNSKDTAADFISHAIDYYIGQHEQGGDKLGAFLAGLPAGDMSALRSQCVAMLQNFEDTFPPAPRSWKLTVESSRRHMLHAGAIVLNGKFDLTLGAAGLAGATGAGAAQAGEAAAQAGEAAAQAGEAAEEAGTVTPGRTIIDLKTGNRNPIDAEDMRFYALLETLFAGVPPMMVGTFYVSEGKIIAEKVDRALLDTAVRRTVAGTKRLVALQHGDDAGGVVEPERRPGPPCNWCDILDDCEPGQKWLDERDD